MSLCMQRTSVPAMERGRAFRSSERKRKAASSSSVAAAASRAPSSSAAAAAAAASAAVEEELASIRSGVEVRDADEEEKSLASHAVVPSTASVAAADAAPASSAQAAPLPIPPAAASASSNGFYLHPFAALPPASHVWSLPFGVPLAGFAAPAPLSFPPPVLSSAALEQSIEAVAAATATVGSLLDELQSPSSPHPSAAASAGLSVAAAGLPSHASVVASDAPSPPHSPCASPVVTAGPLLSPPPLPCPAAAAAAAAANQAAPVNELDIPALERVATLSPLPPLPAASSSSAIPAAAAALSRPRPSSSSRAAHIDLTDDDPSLEASDATLARAMAAFEAQQVEEMREQWAQHGYDHDSECDCDECAYSDDEANMDEYDDDDNSGSSLSDDEEEEEEEEQLDENAAEEEGRRRPKRRRRDEPALPALPAAFSAVSWHPHSHPHPHPQSQPHSQSQLPLHSASSSMHPFGALPPSPLPLPSFSFASSPFFPAAAASSQPHSSSAWNAAAAAAGWMPHLQMPRPQQPPAAAPPAAAAAAASSSSSSAPPPYAPLPLRPYPYFAPAASSSLLPPSASAPSFAAYPLHSPFVSSYYPAALGSLHPLHAAPAAAAAAAASAAAAAVGAADDQVQSSSPDSDSPALPHSPSLPDSLVSSERRARRQRRRERRLERQLVEAAFETGFRETYRALYESAARGAGLSFQPPPPSSSSYASRQQELLQQLQRASATNALLSQQLAEFESRNGPINADLHRMVHHPLLRGLDLSSSPFDSVLAPPPPPPGLTRAEIDRFPTSIVREEELQTGAPLAEQSCVICLGEYAVGDSLRRLPCLHVNHSLCIDEWLARSTSCPLCKTELR